MKRNLIAKALHTKLYAPRIVKAVKGKGSRYTRKGRKPTNSGSVDGLIV